MSFYGTMSGVATDLLSQFGQTVTVRTYTENYDPVTGKNTRTPHDSTTMGVFDNFSWEYMQTHEVKTGDRNLYIDDSVTPELSAKIVVGTEEWSIANIEPVKPGGDVVLYQLQLRK